MPVAPASNKSLSALVTTQLTLGIKAIGVWRSAFIVLVSAVLVALGLGNPSPETPPLSRPLQTPRVGSQPQKPAPAREPKTETLTKLVGQRIIARFRGTTASSSLKRRAARGQIGGVILFSDNISSLRQVRKLTQDLQSAATRAGQPPLWIATDQEGGEIRRFSGLAPDRSARLLGASDTPARSASIAGEVSARELRNAGVNLNLAPVVDVLHQPDSFLSDRTFGTTPGAVATRACSFAEASARVGVIPTLKHFPGLGYSAVSTDSATVSIDQTAPALRADLEAYRSCSNAGMVMVSSASYPKLLKSRLPAVLSGRLYSREFAQVGFSGLTISDDLETPALSAEHAVAERAARAGLDLLLYAKTPGGSQLAYRSLIRAARSGSLSRRNLEDSYAKVTTFKQRRLSRQGLGIPNEGSS